MPAFADAIIVVPNAAAAALGASASCMRNDSICCTTAAPMNIAMPGTIQTSARASASRPVALRSFKPQDSGVAHA